MYRPSSVHRPPFVLPWHTSLLAGIAVPQACLALRYSPSATRVQLSTPSVTSHAPPSLMLSSHFEPPNSPLQFWTWTS